jgi:hypothetical protein
MTTDTIEQSGAMQTIVEARDVAVMPGFNSQGSWELANRIGKAFAASTLVPQAYQGNVANCIVALEMANRMGASPLMVMQNLYIVHGNPGWSAKFLVACFNQCGRFSALRYEWNADRTACRAWAIEKATGERIDGPQVSVQMAKEEGWSTKSGSKWKTMPELMLMYRAAAFLIRTYAPEISMGLQSSEELEDMGAPPVAKPTRPADVVRAAIAAGPAPAIQSTVAPAIVLAGWVERIDNAADAEQAHAIAEQAKAALGVEQADEIDKAYQIAWA